jgi:hypothetical protein
MTDVSDVALAVSGIALLLAAVALASLYFAYRNVVK